MSQRIILEINRDFVPVKPEELAVYTERLARFLDTGASRDLPMGAKLIVQVAHSDILANGGIMREVERWRSAVQSLTPGGSEYQSPEAVLKFVQEEREQRGRDKVQNAKIRKAGVALLKVFDAVAAITIDYLRPDGIDATDAITKVILATDTRAVVATVEEARAVLSPKGEAK